MNALDSQRALLDSLMGAHRNFDDDEEPAYKKSWRDEDVCKYYLCGFCPHDLFVNTKSDLGQCDNIHDDELQKEFQSQKSSRKEKYERRFLAYLEDIVHLLERRIQRGKERISVDKSVDSETEEGLSREQRDRLEEIETQVEDYTEKMEDLGNEGRVEEAQELLMKVEQLTKEKISLTMSSTNTVDRIQERKMTVCEVCGAFLVLNDAEIRVDAHLRGRTHQGFKMVRDKIDEILEKLAARRNRSRSRSRSRSKRHRKRRKRRSVVEEVKDSSLSMEL